MKRSGYPIAAALAALLGGAVAASEMNYGPNDTSCRIYGQWYAISKPFTSTNVEDHDMLVTPDYLVKVGDPEELRFLRVQGYSVKGYEAWSGDRFAVYRAPDGCKNCSRFVTAHVQPAGKYAVQPCDLRIRTFLSEEYLTNDDDNGGVFYAPIIP